MIKPAEVARELKADPSQVTRWVKRGMPLTTMAEAVAWHAGAVRPRRRQEAQAEPGTPAAPPATMAAQLLAARLEREQSDASTAAIRLAELRGEMIRVELAKRMWRNIAARVKEPLKNLPPRMAPLLAPETDQARIELLLDAEVHRIFVDLAAGIAAAECAVGQTHDDK